ncbi:Endonuclease I [Flammeovirgaceae bacterium 311]|nr:Endonuclease I [Flammeovirgaceae bacterium 311]
MRRNLLIKTFFLLVFALCSMQAATGQAVFINEIHYDNDGTDSGEAIEIAGPAGTDVSGWSVVLYNGNNGAAYDTKTLSGTISDQSSGFGFIVINYPSNGIQNGAPDGVALVDNNGNVLQFLSYEGTFTAVGGPADGMLSTDIGVSEAGGTASGSSLQLSGNGTTYTDFSWAPEATATFGSLNSAQSFGEGGGGTDPDPDPDPDPTPGASTIVFINEIHYDNAGTDENEGVELAGLAGTSLNGWQLIPYNGNNGASYSPLTLSGVIPDQQAGFGTVFFPISGLQNGAPDGIALVDAEANVIQFLSYEGTFAATDGPAAGLTSTDIGVEEGSGTPADFSLQLTGTGSAYKDFTWAAEAASTYNAVNNEQQFLPLQDIVFINEIHYDNNGADTGEGVEVAGNAGADLEGWQLVAYNGSNGAAYATTNLSGVIPNLQNGYGTVFFAISGLQNGAPDGIALIDPEGAVVQFLSYEGTFTAAGGPADGMLSTDIGVEETSTTPEGHSLQLTGTGFNYADFTWSGPVAGTYNEINTGQSFSAGGGTDPDPEPQEVSIAEARNLPLGTQVIINGTLTAVNELGGPAYLQDETGGIPVFDYQVHGPDGFSIGDSIQVTASIGAFNQMLQLVDVTNVESYGPANSPIAPLVVSIAEITPALEGQLVTITGASFTDTRGLLFPESNYNITDGTGTIALRIDGDVESLVGREIPDEAVTITGVLSSFRGTLQLLPRFIEDLPGTTPYEPEGTDIPFATTLDVMSWNMEFFGSTLPNFGPENVQLQLQNAKEVIERANADVIAVQEISDEGLLQELADMLGYIKVCSDRFSYSFGEPDPTFPDQKLCFLYNPATITLVDERVIFEEMYDAARSGASTPLDPYPTGNPSSFWSSGRLPYMITVDATIEGNTERIQLINIHAKSGSSAADLRRRFFDVQALNDTLDHYYPDANLILLGDYNDDVDESIGGGPSTYIEFIEAENFQVVTSTLSEAGLRSFITQDNVIDHIAISDELYDNYLAGTESLLIPFSYISNYGNTTSDHLPVFTRFELYQPLVASISGDDVVYYGYAPEECTTLTASVSGGKGEYTYIWSTGESTASIETCPETSTTYTLTVLDGAGNSTTETFSVCAIDATCGNDKLQLCWQPNSNVNMQLCLPAQLADFFIRRGASIGACFAEQACAPDNKDVNARISQSTDVQYLEINSAFSVTPNLISGKATVDFIVLEEGRTTVKLYTVDGRELATLYDAKDSFGTARSAEFNVDSYKSGLYVVRMTTASGEAFTSKIIVKP